MQLRSRPEIQTVCSSAGLPRVAVSLLVLWSNCHQRPDQDQLTAYLHYHRHLHFTVWESQEAQPPPLHILTLCHKINLLNFEAPRLCLLLGPGLCEPLTKMCQSNFETCLTPALRETDKPVTLLSPHGSPVVLLLC